MASSDFQSSQGEMGFYQGQMETMYDEEVVSVVRTASCVSSLRDSNSSSDSVR